MFDGFSLPSDPRPERDTPPPRAVRRTLLQVLGARMASLVCWTAVATTAVIFGWVLWNGLITALECMS